MVQRRTSVLVVCTVEAICLNVCSDGRGLRHVQGIRKQKLQQLEQAGVPSKYHAQLARKVFAM